MDLEGPTLFGFVLLFYLTCIIFIIFSIVCYMFFHKPCSTRQPFREELVRCWTTSSPLLKEVCVQTGNQEEALGSLLGKQEVTILQIETVARSDPHMPASIPTNLLVLVTVKEEKAPPFLAGATPSHRGPEGFTSSSIGKRPSDLSLPFDLALLIS